MFGPQDENQQGNDDKSMEQGVNAIVNNDVTPPPNFTPPSSSDDQSSSNSPTDDSHGSDTQPVEDGANIITPTVDTNGLLGIKQQALTKLSPLVDHLEQSPEEKFRTTMMMIQASDDQSLVKDAYEAAQEISDEKTRAQALLDVINEINYFTQHNKA
jgi:hypothetical protein